MRKLFSNTLESVEGNATLVDGDPVAVVAERKRQSERTWPSGAPASPRR